MDAGDDLISRFQQGCNAERKQAVEIHVAKRVVGTDFAGLLENDRAFVEAVDGPEDGEPGLRRALDQRPVDR